MLDGSMWKGPRNGNKDDRAHPPIHPVKLAKQEDLKPREWQIYNLVTRHFLGSLSKDATGFETNVKLEMGEEHFSMSGLQVEAANYLNVYTFEKWAEKDVPAFQLGEMLQPANLDCKEGKT